MKLAAYFDRIAYHGPAQPDLQTLRALHRAHLLAIPFENIDVLLHRPVGLDIDAIHEKLVTRRRGGWCFEMNGLFGWALQEIGFSVTRLAAGVMREVTGDAALGNHLALKVDIDAEPWIADVGFGDGPLEPYPLYAGDIRAKGQEMRLTDLGDGWWRFSQGTLGAPFSYDFRDEPGDAALLAAKCEALQTDPDSVFVRNLVCQRHFPNRHVALRGRVVRTLWPSAVEKTVLETKEEFVGALRSVFGLDIPAAADLWPAVNARHAELFPDGDAVR